MRIIFTFCALLLSYSILPAQNQLQLTFNLDSTDRQVNFDAMGVNMERMFYRVLDSDGKIPDEIFDDLVSAGDLIYRWPGGSTANFFHFRNGTAKGYGLSRKEMVLLEQLATCNIPDDGSDNCMSFDVSAKRNHLYDLLDYSDAYYERTGKKKKILWLPNILTFFLVNKEEITRLNAANSLEEARQMAENGEISMEFYEKLKDNIDVYEILDNHPTINLLGIEYGNEFYFHIPVTNLRYNYYNNRNIWNNESQESKKIKEDSLRLGIHQCATLIRFFNKVILSKNPNLETAFPIVTIPANGDQPPVNLIWNTAVRDSILPLVDGVIHHFYFRETYWLRLDPKTSEDNNAVASGYLNEIKKLSDQFLHDRIPKVDQQYDSFFNLTPTGKKLWITEFNTSKIPGDGFFSEWQNTFFHASFQFEAFISFIDNAHNTDIVKYAFPHLWASHYNDYDYGCYAVQIDPNGTYKKIKRTTFSTYELLGSLMNRNLKKIKFEATNTKKYNRANLYTQAYFEPSDGTDQNEIGKIYFVFSNKSREEIKINPNNDFIIQSTSVNPLKYQNGFSKWFSAPNIYSSNGFTVNDKSNETQINVVTEDNLDIDPAQDIIIPKYAAGYIAFPIYKEGVATSIKDVKKQSLNIYPNPSKSNISITANQDINWRKGNFFVTDASGKISTVKVEERNSNILRLNISELPAGVYQFVYYYDNSQYTTPFVVQ